MDNDVIAHLHKVTDNLSLSLEKVRLDHARLTSMVSEHSNASSLSAKSVAEKCDELEQDLNIVMDQLVPRVQDLESESKKILESISEISNSVKLLRASVEQIEKRLESRGIFSTSLNVVTSITAQGVKYQELTFLGGQLSQLSEESRSKKV